MLLTTLAALAMTAPSSWNLPGQGPHLMFHYMPWFVLEHPEGKLKAWDHWEWNGPGTKHNPSQRLLDGRRDIASAYYPLIGPYTTSDRDVLRYHFRTIRAAGGEAIAIDWYTPDNPLNDRMPAILDEAQKAGLKVAVCYEEKANFVWADFRDPKTREEAMAAAVKDLNYVIHRFANHPAYLRRDGKPFVFQFNGWGQGKIGPQFFTGPEYRQVMAKLDAPIMFCRQGLEDEYDETAPGRYLWMAHAGKDIRWFGEESRRRIDGGKQQFFMSFLSPGFDDSGVSGWSGTPRIQPREGLSFLWGTFRNAFVGNPEIVQVVTWNDFNEGTVVEPTREIGFQYLDAIATWWAEHNGTRPDLDAIRKPFLDYARGASGLAKKELPSSLTSYLAKRSLKVADSGFLEGENRSKGF